MAIKLLLIISVFTVCKYGLSKPSEEASIRLNINLNTDQGVDDGTVHKSVLLHKTQGGGGPPPPKPGHGRALKGCTVFGQAGDGTTRGSCRENFKCYADGSCKPTQGTDEQLCTVLGSNGDGINRGSCDEGRICFRDGSCKLPGAAARSGGEGDGEVDN